MGRIPGVDSLFRNTRYPTAKIVKTHQRPFLSHRRALCAIARLASAGDPRGGDQPWPSGICSRFRRQEARDMDGLKKNGFGPLVETRGSGRRAHCNRFYSSPVRPWFTDRAGASAFWRWRVGQPSVANESRDGLLDHWLSLEPENLRPVVGRRWNFALRIRPLSADLNDAVVRCPRLGAASRPANERPTAPRPSP
jgi:hypothetical protein